MYSYFSVTTPENVALDKTSYILTITSAGLLLPMGVIITATLLGGLGKSARDEFVKWWMVRSDRLTSEDKWVLWPFPRMSKREIKFESELRDEEILEDEDVIRERRRDDFD